MAEQGLQYSPNPRKQDTLVQFCFNAGTPSTTWSKLKPALAQRLVFAGMKIVGSALLVSVENLTHATVYTYMYMPHVGVTQANAGRAPLLSVYQHVNLYRSQKALPQNRIIHYNAEVLSYC